MRAISRAGARLAALVALALALRWAGEGLPPLPRSPHAALAALRAAPPELAVPTVAGWLAWPLLGWLALVVASTTAAALPGRLGRLAAALAGRITPVLVRRAVAAALGVSLSAGPAAAAGAATSTPRPHAWPDLDRVATAPAAPRRATTAPPDRHHRPPAAVRVRPGDTLWSIAAHALGGDPDDARIAAEWPRWYARNRSVIGPDPNLLRPGQLLHPPAPHSDDPSEERP